MHTHSQDINSPVAQLKLNLANDDGSTSRVAFEIDKAQCATLLAELRDAAAIMSQFAAPSN